MLRPAGATEGEFLGEGNMIAGRRALIRALVSETGEVFELDRQQLLALVPTDAELNEIVMGAFILRRVELIANGFGDVVVIGSMHCAGTLRVKEFLTRNGHPFAYIDLDQDATAQELLDHADHLHHGLRRCADGGPSDEGGSGRVLDEALRRSGAVVRHSERRRA